MSTVGDLADGAAARPPDLLLGLQRRQIQAGRLLAVGIGHLKPEHCHTTRRRACPSTATATATDGYCPAFANSCPTSSVAVGSGGTSPTTSWARDNTVSTRARCANAASRSTRR